ncbi:hypothetical protein SLS58_002846 [Diplodia intermedia]|uniref:Uncharacterized protein n=1 Tax=Diplodia intermedia TaxID=856260 RepID=A0ABR3TYG1_9PEZI
MARYHPSTSSLYFTHLLVMEKCKAITTNGAPCTANVVNDGYCIVHFKRHAKAISPPASLSPHTPRSASEIGRNKPLPTLPLSSADGSPSSLHRRRRIIRSPAGDHDVQSPVRHKPKIKTPKPSKHKQRDASLQQYGRDDICVDLDSSDSEEIFVQLQTDEQFEPSIPHTDSTYGSEDSIISHRRSRSTTSSRIDDDSEWKPYYMGARWRGTPPNGVMVVGDKDGDRILATKHSLSFKIGQHILEKTRKRFAKEKYDKVHNNGEKSSRREGDKDHNPSPVRWPFSSPTTGTFDEDSQQSNEEEESPIKTENKEKRPLLHRRGIISEINIAIDSIAEFADSDEEDTRKSENERPPLATVWELDRVCETLQALRLQHVGSENLALDAFYREALVQVWRVLDTHVEMRREEGGEGREGEGG